MRGVSNKHCLLTFFILFGLLPEAHEVKSTENLTMYIGLCVASTVFIIVIIIIIIIIKRRSSHQRNDNSHFTSGGNCMFSYDIQCSSLTTLLVKVRKKVKDQ